MNGTDTTVAPVDRSRLLTPATRRLMRITEWWLPNAFLLAWPLPSLARWTR